MSQEDRRIQLVKNSLVGYPDFPKPGILFQDLFGVMLKPEAMSALMSLLRDKAKSLEGKVDCVVGLDARGFLFGKTILLLIYFTLFPSNLHSTQGSI